MVDNPDMITELGNKLYDTVNGTYDMVSVCKNRLELYSNLVAEKKSDESIESLVINA